MEEKMIRAADAAGAVDDVTRAFLTSINENIKDEALRVKIIEDAGSLILESALRALMGVTQADIDEEDPGIIVKGQTTIFDHLPEGSY